MICANTASVAASSPTMLSSSGITLHPAARLGASTDSSDALSATESSPITTAKANNLNAAQPESDNTNESSIRKFNALTESITPVNKSSPVVGGIWNQDLMFVCNGEQQEMESSSKEPESEANKMNRPQWEGPGDQTIERLDAKTINKKLVTGQGWDVVLSESSDDSDAEGTVPKKARKIKERKLLDVRTSLADHDYCFEAYLASTRPPPKPEVVEDLSEMDKILSNVAMGASIDNGVTSNIVGSSGLEIKKHKKNRKHKKKKKKRSKRKSQDHERGAGSSSSDSELDVVTSSGQVSRKALKALTALPRGPKPKFHTPTGAAGITAAAARPHFSSSDDDKDSENSEKRDHSTGKDNEDYGTSVDEIASSDLDTDFSADDLAAERITTKSKRITKPSAKIAAAAETEDFLTTVTGEKSDLKPVLKLKIKLPQKSLDGTPVSLRAGGKGQKVNTPTQTKTQMPIKMRKATTPSAAAALRRKAKLVSNSNTIQSKEEPKRKKKKYRRPSLLDTEEGFNISDKMRRSLALNRAEESDTDSDNSDHELVITDDDNKHMSKENNMTINHALADAKVYCYCQSPHDDVSEMIGNLNFIRPINLIKVKLCL